MTLRLGDIAPDFTQVSTAGTIRFHAWLGPSWGVLVSHQKDFTAVSTTELGCLARLRPEFERRRVKVLAVSVDDLDAHRRWILDINDTQATRLEFPILADLDRKVSHLYELIPPSAGDALTVRSAFVIDPARRIRVIVAYPASVGRSVDELLRVIDAIQLTDRHPVATPVDWHPGEDVIFAPSLIEPAAPGAGSERRDDSQPRRLSAPGAAMAARAPRRVSPHGPASRDR